MTVPLSRSLPPVYAAAAVRLLFPLLVLPLVAARVGPQEFGRLSFILVWSGLLAMVIEGGFLAAATRLAVTADAAGRWRLAQQVFSARCVLSLPAVLLSFVAAAWGGQAGADALAIAALACALGWPATWYLQATQQLARWARVELAVYGALLALCGAFATSVAAFVTLQLLASAVLSGLGWWWLRRDLADARTAADGLWARPQLVPGLRLGWTMMPVSIAGAAYSFALPAAATAQMPKAELGLYFMADRIVRAVLAAADPVFSLVYPRIVGLFRRARARRCAMPRAGRWAARWRARPCWRWARCCGPCSSRCSHRAPAAWTWIACAACSRCSAGCCRCCWAGSSSATGCWAAAVSTAPTAPAWWSAASWA